MHRRESLGHRGAEGRGGRRGARGAAAPLIPQSCFVGIKQKGVKCLLGFRCKLFKCCIGDLMFVTLVTHERPCSIANVLLGFGSGRKRRGRGRGAEVSLTHIGRERCENLARRARQISNAVSLDFQVRHALYLIRVIISDAHERTFVSEAGASPSSLIRFAASLLRLSGHLRAT